MQRWVKVYTNRQWLKLSGLSFNHPKPVSLKMRGEVRNIP
jgi:hypothetical protein